MVFVHATLNDEFASIEKELEEMQLKKVAKKSTDENKASALIDLLKKELLDGDIHADEKKKISDAIKKEANDIVATKNEFSKKAEQKEVAKKEASKAKFFEDLESQDDDFDNDPLAKRAIEMMTKDMVTREVQALSDEGKDTFKLCSDTNDKCCDKIRNCKFIAKKNMCHIDTRIPNYCPKSCQFCNIATQPKCRKTKYGCCWDKMTEKLDKSGKNCPLCKDDYKYMCKTFLSECKKISKAGEFMRIHCKKSCDFCDEKCADDKKMAFYCPFWKNDLEWCEKQKETMHHFCPVTCGFC